MNKTETAKLKKKNKGNLKKIFSNTLYIVIIVFGLAFLSFNLFFGKTGPVNGSSMYPTIKDGEIYVSWNTKDVARGDIIILNKNAQHGELIKRIIGLPGDTIKIENGVLYVNNIETPEDYIKQETLVEDFDEITLKEGEYFYMGDNRLTSKDARVYGPASKEDIQGKVITYFPSLKNLF